MKEIHIRREELLKLLNKNLEIHTKIYKKSMEAFKKNYNNRLSKMLKIAEKNKFVMDIELNKPENHRQDYEDAVHAVTLDERAVIVLNQDEFARYILNRWTWIGYFKHAYFSNVSSSSSSKNASSSSTSSTDREIDEYFRHSDDGF